MCVLVAVHCYQPLFGTPVFEKKKHFKSRGFRNLGAFCVHRDTTLPPPPPNKKIGTISQKYALIFLVQYWGLSGLLKRLLLWCFLELFGFQSFFKRKKHFLNSGGSPSEGPHNPPRGSPRKICLPEGSKFSEKIGGKSVLENRAFSGLIGAFPGPVGAFLGPIGTNSSTPHSHGGKSRNCPEKVFLAQLAPFGLLMSARVHSLIPLAVLSLGWGV